MRNFSPHRPAFQLGRAAILGFGLVIFPAAWAQSGEKPGSPPAAATDLSKDRAAAPAAPEIDVNAIATRDLRHKPVYGSDHDKVATIKEVMGSPGQSRQVILETGGILGIGGRQVALPLEKLNVAPDGKLVVHMTDDQLRLLPTMN
jgi:PRC-barrel domain